MFGQICAQDKCIDDRAGKSYAKGRTTLGTFLCVAFFFFGVAKFQPDLEVELWP